MAITVARAPTAADGFGSAGVTLTLSSLSVTPNPGDLLVVVVWNTGNGTAPTVTDSNSAGLTQQIWEPKGNAESVGFFSYSPLSIPTTITVNAVSGNPLLFASLYWIQSAIGTPDGTAAGTASSSTGTSTSGLQPTVPTTQSGDVVLSGLVSSANVTAASVQPSATYILDAAAGSGGQYISGHGFLAPAGSASPYFTWSSSRQWAQATLAFPPAQSVTASPATASVTASAFSPTPAISIVAGTASVTATAPAVNPPIVTMGTGGTGGYGTHAYGTFLYGGTASGSVAALSASVAATAFSPTVTVSATPNTASVVASAISPTVGVGVMPTTASVVASAPAATPGVTVTPATASVVGAAFAPSLSVSITVTAPTATATTTAFAPGVGRNVTVTPDALVAVATAPPVEITIFVLYVTQVGAPRSSWFAEGTSAQWYTRESLGVDTFTYGSLGTG